MFALSKITMLNKNKTRKQKQVSHSALHSAFCFLILHSAMFHITYKKEERKEQLHNSAQVTAAPSGGFSRVFLFPFEHKSYSQ